jgi:hypothetical protein
MPRALLLAGMHRSGTSMLASWIDDIGIRLTLGACYPADAGNPLGHFEDIEFARISENAVRRSPSGAHGWQVVDHGEASFRILGRDRWRARRLALSRYLHASQWGWKDPRAVLCAEDWIALVPGLRILGVWRPAAAVVDSLLRRAQRMPDKTMYQVSERASLQTWISSNEELLRVHALFPGRVEVVDLRECIVSDGRVVEDSLRRMGFRVNYRPLVGVFRESQLIDSDRSSGDGDLWTRAVQIEERLRKVSRRLE